MAEPLTREAFERSRAAAKAVMNRHSGVLALFSVAGGVAQLLFLRWADAHLARGPKLTIELPVFVAYMAGVIFLLWRLDRSVRAVRLRCPQCGVELGGTSERIAVATGKCDSCGGGVIGEP